MALILTKEVLMPKTGLNNKLFIEYKKIYYYQCGLIGINTSKLYMDNQCISCNLYFKSNKCLQQHLKCKRHTDRLNKLPHLPTNVCDVCGKKYFHRQSLRTHKISCDVSVVLPIQNNLDILEQRMDEMKQAFEKERLEMKSQIALLLDKHAGTINHNTTNIETQNITININAFGNENTDYIDDKAILSCISKVYKSIPSLLEKIHFDPKHPENHNIKITNKKLPYASVMGNNQKWKTVDRKDAIETMVLNGYNMLDEKYAENKEKIPASKQQNFEGFQTKFESEDKDLMRFIKTEVDMMVLNGGG